LSLQGDLRALGYLETGIDGFFGPNTEAAVKALQFDLLNNKGTGVDGSAPVRLRDYNNSRVTAITGIVDQNLAACISEMLQDERFCKIPNAANSKDENARVLSRLITMKPERAPTPFLLGILRQESGLKHYCEPTPDNPDSLVIVGLDMGSGRQPVISSRGYGVGQYTLFHHPPTAAEMNSIISDPSKNVQQAVRLFRDKFDRYVNGNTPGTRADERQAEFGRGGLRLCKHSPTDPRHMADCRKCLVDAGSTDIVAGATRFYEGARRYYEPTRYHLERRYRAVPIRANIGCDWPYAVRRYNGGGLDSYHYQAKVLLHVLQG
jgi:peptidoglycan hydrolase-like protein with peptidoglycan-binding domain